MKRLKPNDPVTCSACGLKFTSVSDFHRHLHEDVPNPYATEHGLAKTIQRYDDPTHKGIHAAARRARGDCFCGGHVSTFTHRRGPDDVGWETVCLSCDYLYDED